MFPHVPLAKIIKPTVRPEVPIPGVTYRQIGVRLWGAGAYERESIDGGETKYKTLSKMAENDIIFNKIWARNGSVALVSKALEGTYGSGEFPTFSPDRNLLDPRWFHWITKTKWFWDQCDLKSRGTSGKNRIRPEKFLQIEIPMPPLPEQRRIVAKIDALAAKIGDVHSLRKKAKEEADALVISLHMDLAGRRIRELGDVVLLDEDTVPVEYDMEYPQVGIKCFGAGLFKKPAVKGSDTTYKAFNRLYPGALVLSQVKGWEGAVAVAGDDLAGWFVSPEYRTFRCIGTEAIPNYLSALVRTEWFWNRLQSATRGVGARRERTRPEQFLNIKMPMPNLDQQKSALPAFQRLDAMKKLQAQTTAELDALLPAILDRAFKGEL